MWASTVLLLHCLARHVECFTNQSPGPSKPYGPLDELGLHLIGQGTQCQDCPKPSGRVHVIDHNIHGATLVDTRESLAKELDPVSASTFAGRAAALVNP